MAFSFQGIGIEGFHSGVLISGGWNGFQGECLHFKGVWNVIIVNNVLYFP